MKMNKYFEQAKLMLSILPIVGQEKEFAIKGGIPARIRYWFYAYGTLLGGSGCLFC